MKLVLTIVVIVYALFGLLLYACIKAAGDYTRDEERGDDPK